MYICICIYIYIYILYAAITSSRFAAERFRDLDTSLRRHMLPYCCFHMLSCVVYVCVCVFLFIFLIYVLLVICNIAIFRCISWCNTSSIEDHKVLCWGILVVLYSYPATLWHLYIYIYISYFLYCWKPTVWPRACWRRLNFASRVWTN